MATYAYWKDHVPSYQVFVQATADIAINGRLPSPTPTDQYQNFRDPFMQSAYVRTAGQIEHYISAIAAIALKAV